MIDLTELHPCGNMWLVNETLGGGEQMRTRVLELRKERKLSQEQLSELSGVSRATIVRLESGEDVETTTKTLNALANALNVDVTDLFLGLGG